MKRIQTRKRLAELYEIDSDTFTKWLKQIGITHRGGLKPLDLLTIAQKIGTPEQLKRAKEMFKS